MSAHGVLHVIEGGSVGFWCPGCQMMHVLGVTTGELDWYFDGDYDRPTFAPSVLVTGRDFTPKGRADWRAWYGTRDPRQPAPEFESAETRCHSFVRDGHIVFLADCSHALAGKTVAMVLPDGVN